MRLDKRDITRSSDREQDTPDLLEERISKRGRVPKREWPKVEFETTKEQRNIGQRTPTSTQTSTQTLSQIFTQISTSIPIYEDEPDAKPTESPLPAGRGTR